MIPVLAAAQARAFDRFASEECGVPSLVLMENAGLGAAQLLRERISPRERVLCVCGLGNNGGDGFVVARHLARLGQRVSVVLLGRPEQLSHDAGVNHSVWQKLGGAVREVVSDAEPLPDDVLAGADVVVDALLGTGLGRDLSGRFLQAVRSINASGLPTFALDVPSGLNADTGAVMGAAIRARCTITFGHPKPGLLTTSGAEHAGELLLADLGVPRELGPAREPFACWLEASDVRGWSKARRPSAHKGSAGRVVVVAGSPGRTGAALLASTGALRAGAGLVTLCTFPEAARRLDQRVVEAMTEAIDPEHVEASLERVLENADACVLGPGLGLDEAARRAVDYVVLSWPGSKVVDADAITHFRGRAAELARAAGACLLTPHPGELGRLLDQSAGQVEADRFDALERALGLTRQTILLKGPHTLIGKPGVPPWVASMGHPVLATGGAGDVLSGICAAFAASLPLERAGALAAYVHGAAARRWVAAHAGADRGILAREVADALPDALAALSGG